jgi:UDP-N-acetylmuramoyl-L-alanyl-D-glutamate--2,6-diaminopimelate ligase
MAATPTRLARNERGGGTAPAVAVERARMTTLGELLDFPGLPGEVSGLCADSRKVAPGDAFFALAGARDDGLRHVAQAVARGAAAVVAERRPEGLGGAVFAQVANAHLALAHAASRFYPARPATIVAVTGTSGKTSVAAFVRQIWESLGFEAASLGTIGVVSRPVTVYGSLTTPDPVALHQTLTRLAEAGVTHLAMEASSHGLDQKRLDGVTPAAAGFTNLSRDHMDYHATEEEYLAAKLRLFRDLLPKGGPAVIDADSEIAPRVIAAVREAGRMAFTVGAKGEAIRLASAKREGFSTRVSLVHAGRSYEALLPLPGDFQVSNALVAAGLCLASGSPAEEVFAALDRLEGAPGRLERIGDKRGAPVFVDYAHKPDALEKALAALRPFVAGRLVVVFGCGGDRDPGKRPMMGEIATRAADVVIVTDDNPRSENPAAIRAAILTAAPGAREIGDRAEAIRAGIGLLQPGDALVIAGKGHETGQIVGERVLPFSDADEARAALETFA